MNITGIDVFMGLILACGLFIMVLYLMTRRNEQEQKINSQAESIDEKTIEARINALGNDDLDKILAEHDPSTKPKA